LLLHSNHVFRIFIEKSVNISLPSAPTFSPSYICFYPCKISSWLAVKWFNMYRGIYIHILYVYVRTYNKWIATQCDIGFGKLSSVIFGTSFQPKIHVSTTLQCITNEFPYENSFAKTNWQAVMYCWMHRWNRIIDGFRKLAAGELGKVGKIHLKNDEKRQRWVHNVCPHFKAIHTVFFLWGQRSESGYAYRIHIYFCLFKWCSSRNFILCETCLFVCVCLYVPLLDARKKKFEKDSIIAKRGKLGWMKGRGEKKTSFP
jgi:hypothetical protein